MDVPNTPVRDTLLQKALAIAVVLTPLATAYVGGQFALASKARESDGRLVELAATILREPPKEQAVDVRDWAMDVLDKYSGVPISSQARAALSRSIAFPQSGAVTADIKVNGQDGKVLIKSGEPYRYEWHSNNATACLIGTFNGDRSGSTLNGISSPVMPTETWYPAGDTPFVIVFTCTNGTSSASDVVMVGLAR